MVVKKKYYISIYKGLKTNEFNSVKDLPYNNRNLCSTIFVWEEDQQIPAPSLRCQLDIRDFPMSWTLPLTATFADRL